MLSLSWYYLEALPDLARLREDQEDVITVVQSIRWAFCTIGGDAGPVHHAPDCRAGLGSHPEAFVVSSVSFLSILVSSYFFYP